jgi:hypothetical protein
VQQQQQAPAPAAAGAAGAAAAGGAAAGGARGPQTQQRQYIPVPTTSGRWVACWRLRQLCAFTTSSRHLVVSSTNCRVTLFIIFVLISQRDHFAACAGEALQGTPGGSTCHGFHTCMLLLPPSKQRLLTVLFAGCILTAYRSLVTHAFLCCVQMIHTFIQ